MNGHPRAVLFDLDGTFYHQSPLRLAMAAELATLPLGRGPWAARHIWRCLGAFRRQREKLRELGAASEPLASLQYEITARHLGVDVADLEGIIEEWIQQRPLRYLRPCRRRGIRALLSHLQDRGLPLGVFSDYPVDEKLEALGLGDHLPLRLCSTDSEINAFKPHPKGFLRACTLWGLEPGEVLYVGDRVEVDAIGAAAAGLACAILARRLPLDPSGNAQPAFRLFTSCTGLRDAIDAGG